LSDVPSKPDIYVRRLPKHYPYFFAFWDVNVANFLTKGNIMHLSVHAGFLIAIVGAVTISPMGMARAQDVKFALREGNQRRSGETHTDHPSSAGTPVFQLFG
jgi:hypothetical protein